MASFIVPYVKPIADLWNSICVDQHQKQLFEQRGHTGSLGADWTSHYLRSEQDVYNHEYLEWHRRFTEEPELKDVVVDNVWRLTVFAGIERALAIRQAQAVLKTQFQGVTQSFAGAVQSTLNAGTIRGYFKGSLLNLVQLCGAPYQALLWAGNQANLSKQIAYSSLFEAVFFPLDTIKTNIYCDTIGQYKGAIDCAQKLIQNGGVARLYHGVIEKVLFNSAILFHLKNVYEGNDLQWISLPILAAAYPLLVLKTRTQVAGTPLSLASLGQLTKISGQNYAGVVPFLVFNTLFAYQFATWYSPTAQNRIVQNLQNAMKQFVSPGEEHVWSS